MNHKFIFWCILFGIFHLPTFLSGQSVCGTFTVTPGTGTIKFTGTGTILKSALVIGGIEQKPLCQPCAINILYAVPTGSIQVKIYSGLATAPTTCTTLAMTITNAAPMQWLSSSTHTGTIYRTGDVNVDGIIKAKRVSVKLDVFADYVFDKNYHLMPLNDLEKFIQKNKHLPNIPSEKEMTKTEVSLNELAVKQMEKIEELTLYILQLNKRLESLEQENECLKAKEKNNHPKN